MSRLKATTATFDGGKCLVLPKHGFAPMLFLEWCTNLFVPSEIVISDVGFNEDVFFIELKLPSSAINACVEHINENLPS